jgi:hypothetical protein
MALVADNSLVEGSPADRDYLIEAACRDDVLVPDVVEEILGWKVLAITGEGHLHHHLDQMHPLVIPSELASPLTKTYWPPRAWLRATCSTNAEHEPPVEECGCGIYAVAEASGALGYVRRAPLTVLARVGLAGKLIPGSRGWRAERGRVVALTQTGIGQRDYPGLFAQVVKRYDVPVLDLDLIKRPFNASVKREG